MPRTFKYTFDTPAYKGTVTLNTGLFINGEFVDPIEARQSLEVINPATGKVLTTVSAGDKRDIDRAVDAATKAFKTSWGLKAPGAVRGKLLNKLADLIEQNIDEFAALEALDVGKIYQTARAFEIASVVDTFRYYAGWAGKTMGQTIETTEAKFSYTRREPYGVVGQITPWNFPLIMIAWKIAPALATGNTVILKPSEVTPLTSLKLASLINEAGFPPGVLNIVNGYGHVVGQAISEHPKISKLAFTGSTLTGKKIMEAAAKSNLKDVMLELGGKSPNIIFDDADLEQAAKWASHGIFFNMGQACIAGSRIYVQEGIYDQFIEKFIAIAKSLGDATGDPFAPETKHGPQVSKAQYDRVMGYIDAGIKAGATVAIGGEPSDVPGGYYIKPTIFTEAKAGMKIVEEEIFGPVAVVIKFKDEEDAIEQANNTAYGLASCVFTQNLNRALRVSHALEAGTAFINCTNSGDFSVPLGGWKQSGLGIEAGHAALETYTHVKSVHVNTGVKL